MVATVITMFYLAAHPNLNLRKIIFSIYKVPATVPKKFQYFPEFIILFSLIPEHYFDEIYNFRFSWGVNLALKSVFHVVIVVYLN